MRQEPRQRVLVIGDDMRIFLAVVRSLGRAGKEVHAAPFNWHAPALKSRYVDKVHYLPRYSENPSGWRTALAKAISAYQFEVIIPCCDRAILPLHEHRDDFACRIAIPNPTAMTLMFDKDATRKMAAQLGVPVVSATNVSRAGTADDLAQRFGLPLVLKPRSSYTIDRLETWGKVWIVESKPQLDELLRTMADIDRYIVETYFVGSGVGVSVLAQEGQIQHAFQHRRLREGWGGSSSYRISEAVDAELYAACNKICRHTGLTGVCMFEFRYNLDTRKWVLLETNARFWGSMPLPLSLGVDFPVYLFDLLVEGETHPPVPYPVGIRARNLLLDGMNLIADLRRTGPKGLGRWLADVLDFLMQPIRWITGRERSDSFVIDDIRPGLWECAMLLRDLYEKRSRPSALGTSRERRRQKLAASSN